MVAIAKVPGMPESFAAPRGTRDVLAPESGRWEALVGAFAAHVERAGYGLLLSPVFEELGVFQRLGEGTDVVRKEMYDFRDKDDRHLALRPEGTASVVRAFNQHHPLVPWKVWYVTPAFRYEKPQAGRLRQHHQVGVEVLGTADPDVDVEVIALQWDFYRSLGLTSVRLLLNSMGSLDDRAAYVDLLRRWLTERAGDLAPEDRDNADRHPMRVLDSKRDATREITAAAPRLLDHLSPEAEEVFARVRGGLDALRVPYEIDTSLVRGLDYYTHATWEFQATALDAAQNAIGGGGRYDGLAESLGGKPTPGTGFGSGIERLLLACDAEDVFSAPERSVAVFVVDVAGGDAARDLTFELRRSGIAADRAFDRRGMKAQMKAANRAAAPFALLVGEDELAADEVTVRDMATGDQTPVPREKIVDHLRELL